MASKRANADPDNVAEVIAARLELREARARAKKLAGETRAEKAARQLALKEARKIKKAEEARKKQAAKEASLTPAQRMATTSTRAELQAKAKELGCSTAGSKTVLAQKILQGNNPHAKTKQKRKRCENHFRQHQVDC
jgi:hypothetical protein